MTLAGRQSRLEELRAEDAGTSNRRVRRVFSETTIVLTAMPIGMSISQRLTTHHVTSHGPVSAKHEIASKPAAWVRASAAASTGIEAGWFLGMVARASPAAMASASSGKND